MANTFTNWTPEIWSKELLSLYPQVAVMQPLVSTDYEGEIKKYGDTVKARLPVEVTVKSYTREQTITWEAMTPLEYDFTVDQSKYFAFKLDYLDRQELDLDFLKIEAKEAASNVAETVDARLLTHYANTDASNIEGNTTTPVTLSPTNVYSYFLKMAKKLDNQRAPLDVRNAVVPPDVLEIILQSPEMSSRGTSMVDDVIKNGYVGKFGRFKLHVTTNMSTVGGTYPLMFFHPSFISFAYTVKAIETDVRPTNEFTVGTKGLFLYGSTVFTPHDGMGAVLYAAA